MFHNKPDINFWLLSPTSIAVALMAEHMQKLALSQFLGTLSPVSSEPLETTGRATTHFVIPYPLFHLLEMRWKAIGGVGYVGVI